ncbi:MAG: aminotransferase class V-fold PLP-dependent enzyme [Culturomica sp.]|jgi:aspartate aminotransferase-like enzyme|nr:aminotransferase class V-fold PLP-dependent enzyme [Culturomica sp.]
MEKYSIPMVPGPVSVPQEILDAAAVNYGSADLEAEYVDLYRSTARALQKIMRTRNQVVIQTGEGMLALWSALKSVLFPGDRVLALSTGLFGYGIGGMAESAGCEVRTVDFGFNDSVNDFELVERAIREFKPKMITLVHCETPSGTLNDVARIGELKAKLGVPLFYVDAVSGLGGSLFQTDEWQVDLCLGASQKCFSAPANLSFLAVSEKAWELAEERNYTGYDALLPFREAVRNRYFPYTPYWHGTAQLHKASERILNEGLSRVITRHEKVAACCRKRITGMGLELFAAPGALLSPTVTAVKVPAGLSWKKLDARLREQGVVMGGNYGCLAGKVFRVGHMGSQADPELLKEAMDILASVL